MFQKAICLIPEVDNSARFVYAQGECEGWHLQKGTQAFEYNLKTCTDAAASTVKSYLVKLAENETYIYGWAWNDTAYVDPKTLQYPCEWGHDDGGCETDPVFRELCAYSCYPVLDITLNGNDYQYQPADVEDGGALVSSCAAENNKGMLAFAELFLEV